MTEAALQQEFISTLKTLNNTIITIRTFPANAPQVTNAVERGYKTVQEHWQKYGDFSLARVGNELLLCGERLSGETVRSISNLIVYRQLELLESQRCTLQPGLGREDFKKLLEVFCAKVEQINQHGGGLAYVQQLGLTELFFQEDQLRQVEEVVPTRAGKIGGRAVPEREIPKELVDVLLGRESRQALVDEMIPLLAEPTQGARVFLAAVGPILEGLRQNKVYANSAALNQVFTNLETLAPEPQRRQLMEAAADVALLEFDLPVLALLMSQNFQVTTGELLSELLLQRISYEQFAGVIRELNAKGSRLRLTEAAESRQLQFLNDAVASLLATPKGKLYLSKEKAQIILDAGEKARKSRRVQAGVRALVQGNIEVLANEEFVEHLPFVLQKMTSDGMEPAVRDVLTKLSRHFLEVGEQERIRLIRSVVQIGENFIEHEYWHQLELLADPLLLWLKDSEEPDAIYERVCLCLQAFMGRSWREGNKKIGDRVLSLFYRIRAGKLNKDDRIRDLVARVQDRRIDRALLAHLLSEYLDHPEDEIGPRRLILQGPMAIRYLVERLMESKRAQNRLKIIDLLSYGERFLPAVIIDKLAEPMPWYGKRNLLKLLAETGKNEDLQAAFPYLQHEDMRVQREAFNCLYKISDDRRQKLLLDGLNVAGEAMKLQIMQALASTTDGEVSRGLEQVLADYQYYSEELRDALLIQACRVLARCPQPEPERVLQAFLAQRGKRHARKVGNEVWTAALESLRQQEESQRVALRPKTQAGHRLADTRRLTDGATGGEQPLITGLAKERRVHELLDTGQQAPARELLMDLIGEMARQHRFGRAEKLREWLIKLDPLALTDIIKAAELVEEEKPVSVDRLQQDVWDELSDSLSTEEFSVLFHSLERRSLGNEETLVHKGDEQGELYFINSGRIKLYYRKQNRDILLNLMRPGEILGAHVFFDASAWTFSATSLGQTDVAVLKLAQLQQWRESFPALEGKLKQFCAQDENTGQFFEQSDRGRREHARRPLEATAVTMILLNEHERSFGVELQGELLDLSEGGLSMVLRITRKDNARLMLGRSIQLYLPYGSTGEKTMSFHGRIVAVREKNVMDMEYSIHIEFFRELSEKQIEQVARLADLQNIS
mgnify:CR=1 FL=1